MDISNLLAENYMIIKQEKDIYNDYISPEMQKAAEVLCRGLKEVPAEIKNYFSELLIQLIDEEESYVTAYLYSLLINVTFDSLMVEKFCSFLIGNKKFSTNTKYFLWFQIKSFVFRNAEIETEEIKYLKWKLYKEIYEEFTAKCKVSLETIPYEDRNHNLILVITEQFLAVQHAPTKTALGRCKTIGDVLKKDVMLINTAECLSLVGKIPFVSCMEAGYMEQKRGENYQEWKNVKVPYYQYEANMPNVKDIEALLADIRELKPELIVAIGGSGIACSMASNIIPTVAVGLCPSSLECTMVNYQTLGRSLDDAGKELLRKMDMPESSVIESVFTSDIITQTKTVTRAEMNIPEDAFVVSVIGARLNSEITNDFLEMLENSLDEEMHVVFVGRFDSYKEAVSPYEKIRTQSTYLGFQEDILAITEITDLNVNPKRRGGGMSAVESMYHGKPVVSLAYGDVGTNVGPEFHTESYETMSELIKEYKKNKEFYQTQSVKAKIRSDRCLDTDGEFMKIIEEVYRREGITY